MSKNATVTSLLMIVALCCAALAAGCGVGCPGGLHVSDVKLEPATSCLEVNYVDPWNTEQCVSERFGLVNKCSRDLTLDLTKAPFKLVSGSTKLDASGGAAVLEMDFGDGSWLEGTYKIPCLLGTDYVEMSVRIRYLETDVDW